MRHTGLLLAPLLLATSALAAEGPPDPFDEQAMARAVWRSAPEVIAARNEIIAGALESSAPYGLATCLADKLIDRLGPPAMAALADATDENDPRVKQAMAAARQAGADCALGR